MNLPRRLLGTRIHELEVEAGRELTLVSDLHLDPTLPAKTEAFAALVEALPDGAWLIIPGDLFEFWLGRSQLKVSAWQRVPEILACAAARGIRSYVLHGNRDFQLDEHFARAARTTVLDGGLLLRAAGLRALLVLHGDELCRNDLAYQKSKRWLRHRALRALMHRVPYRWAQALVARGRRVSKRSTQARDPQSLRPSRRALAELAEAGDFDLLFGHVHVAASDRLRADGKGRYYVLPEFELPSAGFARWVPGQAPRLVMNGAECCWPGPLPLGD